jgi:hypothetical protein
MSGAIEDRIAVSNLKTTFRHMSYRPNAVNATKRLEMVVSAPRFRGAGQPRDWCFWSKIAGLRFNM